MKWFSIEGILKEIGKIRWPKKAELFKTFGEVLIVVVLFMLFFIAADVLVSFVLKLLGI
ncbi:MAG: preprotein translocase subunit SecE [Erysipelotrichaceae bacterium]|nr:preprotein translocase subunit SecE [Erysipelotrichaceae bacterium]